MWRKTSQSRRTICGENPIRSPSDEDVSEGARETFMSTDVTFSRSKLVGAENVNQMTAGPRRLVPSHASYFVKSPALFSLQSLKQI